MEFYDYYKLFGLPLGAPFSEVQKAYYDKAGTYHPELNPEIKGSEEYLEILREAYDLLSDPEKKRAYDEMLQKIKEAESKKSNSKEVVAMHRKYGNSIKNPLRDLYKPVESTDKDSFYFWTKNDLKWALFFGGIMILMITWCQFLWFDSPRSNRMIGIFFSIGIYMASSYGLTRKMHVWLMWKKNIWGRKRDWAERLTVSLFITLVFLVPVFFIRGMELKRSYHLSHYAKYVRPEQKGIKTNTEAYVIYKVNGVEYYTEFDIEGRFDDFYLQLGSKSKIWVKYSEKDPNISDLVVENKQ